MRPVAVLAALALLGAVHCSGPVEAPRRTVPLVFAGCAESTVTTDLGYEVRVDRVRMVVRDFEFTTGGEAHVARWGGLPSWLVPTAIAHPGHSQGGEVTGEWSGRVALDWTSGDLPLGRATLLLGEYQSANFTFDRATDGEFEAADSVVGAAALLEGSATKEDRATAFSVVLTAPEGRKLVGAPFRAKVTATTPSEIALEILLRDEEEGDTLFDAVDFTALDEDADGELVLSESAESEDLVDATLRIRRAFLTHDHYRLVPRDDR